MSYENLIPEPKHRRFTPRLAAAAALLVTALVGGTYWFARGPAQPPKPPDPVSVLIADFANSTQDAVFSGLLEQALAVGVEGATFVSAYPAARRAATGRPNQARRQPRRRHGGAGGPARRREPRDRGSHREERRRLQAHGARGEPVRQHDIADVGHRGRGTRTPVLAAVGKAAAKVRAELGDRSASADQVNDAESFTAASLEAARAYTSGQELQWAGKYDEALAAYQTGRRAGSDDGPRLLGHGRRRPSSLGRRQDAEEYYKQALARTGRMTDREKYRTRSGYYLLTRNTDKAREELHGAAEAVPDRQRRA